MRITMTYLPDRGKRGRRAFRAGTFEVFGRLMRLRWLPGTCAVPPGYTVIEGWYDEIVARTPQGALVRYRPKEPKCPKPPNVC